MSPLYSFSTTSIQPGTSVVIIGKDIDAASTSDLDKPSQDFLNAIIDEK